MPDEDYESKPRWQPKRSRVSAFLHRQFAVIAETLVLIALLLVVAQTLIVDESVELIFNIAVFSVTTFIGAFLVHVVRSERKQRHESEKLADYLREANQKLHDLDRLKSEFIYLATHQMRTPLTAIRGYVSMILEGDYGDVPDHVRKPLRTVEQSSADMVETIEYFLDVTRIEKGQLDYEKEVFDISEIVRDASDQMDSVIATSGLAFHVDIDDGQEYPVYGDRGKLKQVLINLLDNAVHYTKEGSVTIHLWRYDGVVRIEVQDTGMGLSEDDKERIFTKFGRAQGSEKYNTFGAGLGLYIAQEIVEDHNGTINVESEGKGKGSTFFLELPIHNESAS